MRRLTIALTLFALFAGAQAFAQKRGPVQVVASDPLGDPCGASKMVQVVGPEHANKGQHRCCDWGATELWIACQPAASQPATADELGVSIDNEVTGSGFFVRETDPTIQDSITIENGLMDWQIELLAAIGYGSIVFDQTGSGQDGQDGYFCVGDWSVNALDCNDDGSGSFSSASQNYPQWGAVFDDSNSASCRVIGDGNMTCQSTNLWKIANLDILNAVGTSLDVTGTLEGANVVATQDVTAGDDLIGDSVIAHGGQSVVRLNQRGDISTQAWSLWAIGNSRNQLAAYGQRPDAELDCTGGDVSVTNCERAFTPSEYAVAMNIPLTTSTVVVQVGDGIGPIGGIAGHTWITDWAGFLNVVNFFSYELDPPPSTNIYAEDKKLEVQFNHFADSTCCDDNTCPWITLDEVTSHALPTRLGFFGFEPNSDPEDPEARTLPFTVCGLKWTFTDWAGLDPGVSDAKILDLGFGHIEESVLPEYLPRVDLYDQFPMADAINWVDEDESLHGINYNADENLFDVGGPMPGDGGRRGITNSSIRKPILVFTFDDGAVSAYEVAHPLFEARQLPYTAFISTGLFDTDLPYCDDAGGGEGDGILSAGSAQGDKRVTEAQAQRWVTLPYADVQSHGDKELPTASNTYATMVADWDTNRTWMIDNAGYAPQAHAAPGGNWDEETSVWASAWFDMARTSTPGWNSPGGVTGNEDGGRRFFGGSIFPQGSNSNTGQGLCDYVEQALLPNDTSILVLGFHCVSDAAEAYNGANNTYPVDELTTLLDCVEGWRDAGRLDVTNYVEAMSKRRAHKPRWNRLYNTGFGELTGSTSTAAGWTFTSHAVAQANTDASRGERQVLLTAGTGTANAVNQRFGNLIPGATYVAAIDVEWNNAQGGIEQRISWEVEWWDGQGYGADGSPPVGRRGTRSNTDYGDGMISGQRETMFFLFNASAATGRLGVRIQGAAGADQEWIVRYPRLYMLDQLGGLDTNAFNQEFPGLNTFSNEVTFTSVSDGNFDVNIPILGAHTAGLSLQGRGPSHFLITNVEIDAIAASNYGWEINGRSAQSGQIYCSKSGITGIDDSERTLCAYQDNDSNDEFHGATGTGDTGNEIHFRFIDNSTTSESTKVLVEGYVIR